MLRRRCVWLERRGLGAPRAPSPLRRERGRFLPVCERGTGRGEASKGALGPPVGQGGDPRRRQAGALAQGPARWRPGEGARAGKVQRPETPLGTLSRS